MGTVTVERRWLIEHLRAQANHLTAMVAAIDESASPEQLAAVRDHVFTIRETLQTLEVPLATVTNAEWNRAIGTTRG
jgi:hypothetical protein